MHLLAAAGVALAVQTAVVSPHDAVAIRLLGQTQRAPLRVYLADPSRRLRAVGVIEAGTRVLRVRIPRLSAGVYAPALRIRGKAVVGRGRLSVRALPPAGFGPPGAPACAPSSPRSGYDVFGTAAGAEFWGLFAFNPPGTVLSGPALTYDGAVGKELKIVFRMTSGVPSVFYAVAPDGTRVAPVWGPERHLGSSWLRPGREWGAGFVFSAAGCWRIHAGAGAAQGDIWIDVRS